MYCCDVVVDVEYVDQLIIVVVYWCFGCQYLFVVIVVGESDLFFIVVWVVGSQCCMIVLVEEFGQFLVNEIKIGLVVNVCFVGFEKVFKMFVVIQVGFVWVFQLDEIGNGVE